MKNNKWSLYSFDHWSFFYCFNDFNAWVASKSAVLFPYIIKFYLMSTIDKFVFFINF